MCSGVQGSCHCCGHIGHYARSFQSRVQVQIQPQQFYYSRDGFPSGSSQRPFSHAPFFKQTSYRHEMSNVAHSFQCPQQAIIYALIEDQAREAPVGVIVDTYFIYGLTAQVLFDTGASHSFIASGYVDEY